MWNCALWPPSTTATGTGPVVPPLRWRGGRHLALAAALTAVLSSVTWADAPSGPLPSAPVNAPRDESRCRLYEPFFVALQEFDRCAVNLFASLEIEDPLAPCEATQSTGDLALAVIGAFQPCTPLLEVGVEVGRDGTAVRLAPGLYRHQFCGAVDLAVSLPVGLGGDAPDLGVYLMAIVEIDPEQSGPAAASRWRPTSVRRD
jgi:hypothetical protein